MKKEQTLFIPHDNSLWRWFRARTENEPVDIDSKDFCHKIIDRETDIVSERTSNDDV